MILYVIFASEKHLIQNINIRLIKESWKLDSYNTFQPFEMKHTIFVSFNDRRTTYKSTCYLLVYVIAPSFVSLIYAVILTQFLQLKYNDILYLYKLHDSFIVLKNSFKIRENITNV